MMKFNLLPRRKKPYQKSTYMLAGLWTVMLACLIWLTYELYLISNYNVPKPYIIMNLNTTVPSIPAKLRSQAVMLQVTTNEGQKGYGSGVVIGKNLILTSCHVLPGMGNGDTVWVHLDSSQTVGIVIDKDLARDLALIATPKPLDAVASLELKEMHYGDGIIIIGAPRGIMDLPTIGLFHIYSPDKKAIIVSCNAFSGNSGGPVFNAKSKKVIGIVRAMPSPTPNGLLLTHAVYVVSAQAIREYLEDAMRYGIISPEDMKSGE